MIDLTGRKIGRLTVVGFAGRSSNARPKPQWLCDCECGKQSCVLGENLRTGHTTSCGCLVIERASQRAIHGLSEHSIHSVWNQMRQRCENPNDQAYHKYGAVGITVCDRWKSAKAFFDDMGIPPKGLTIERKDNAKGYSPENCVWATRSQQTKNRRVSRFITVDGEQVYLRDAAERYGIPYKTLWKRLSEGWTVEDAIKSKVKVLECL